MAFKTDQEEFWHGQFGNEYVLRNNDAQILNNKLGLFNKIFKNCSPISSIIEFGANIGLNILALKNIFPDIRASAIEINSTAYSQLKKIEGIQARMGSIFEFTEQDLGQHELVLTSGFLIHINPDLLSEVYHRIHQCTQRYICIAEYYNPTPVMLDYRGHSQRLFKRDFAGDLLDKYSDLKLVNYGFQYHRDPQFPADDLSWFLIQKNSSASN